MSLLLDALKQAEKAKQERTGAGAAPGELEIEQPREETPAPSHEPPRERAREAGPELSIEPLEGDPGTLPEESGDDADDSSGYALEQDEAPENDKSQSLDLDLEALASRLTDSTGRFGRRPGEEQLTPPDDTGVFDPNSATMPSMKNVQQSLRDFYDGTGQVSADEVTAAMGTQRRASEDTGATTRVSQKEARNVFESKRSERRVSRRTVALLGVVVLLLLVGGGGWLWVEMSGVTSVTRPPVARVAPPPRPLPAAEPARPVEEPTGVVRGRVESPPPVAAALAEVKPAPAESAPAAPPPAAMTPEEALAAATTPRRAPTAEAPAEAAAPAPQSAAAVASEPEAGTPARDPQPAAATAPPRSVARGAAAGGESLPIRVARQPPRDPDYTQTRQAFEAFKRGDLDVAAQGYRAVLARAPQNRDALLGLAAVAMRTGQPEQAQQYYLRLLALNPKDRLALAALSSLQTVQDPVQAESRLKLLLEQSPEEGYLHFALGNVYAAQDRWPEAQQAYFNAYRTDKSNGDYAFNLAISLDQLGQHKAALDYYRAALAQAGQQAVTFDRGRVQRRIEALSATLGAAAS